MVRLVLRSLAPQPAARGVLRVCMGEAEHRRPTTAAALTYLERASNGNWRGVNRDSTIVKLPR